MRTSVVLTLTSVVLLPASTNAFVVAPSSRGNAAGALRSTADNESYTGRRAFLSTAAAVFSTVAISAPAHASYSAYVNREKDWQERNTKGEIQYSSARDLKRQLREIAPMNSSDKIFCPNGPSASVSPLMENKCGDREAIPSVFGRTEDVVGNSIPGFKGGAYGLTGESTTLSADVGGFPKYGF